MTNIYELSIIIPALNEEDNILETLNDIQQVLLENKINGEIIVVNDGSTDRTKELVLTIVEKNEGIKLVNHKENKGIGSSFWTGYDNSNGESVVFIPADNQNDSWEILRYLSLLDHVDIVIPFVFNNNVRSLYRAILSYLYRFIINTSFFVNLNYTNGTVLYRKSVLDILDSKSNGFFFNTDIIIRCVKRGYLFAEVPYKLNERKTGASKAISYPSFKQVVRGYFKLLKDFSMIKIGKKESSFIKESATAKRHFNK